MLRMLPDVRRVTIRPVIEATVAKGALVHTDEYDIYARLEERGYGHKTVCHARGEYARDDDGDGFCEVHVNTAEGFWSLLRSWLRPHRGAASHRRSCPPISASSSSSTTPGAAGRRCSAPSWTAWSRELRDHPETRQEPRLFLDAAIYTGGPGSG